MKNDQKNPIGIVVVAIGVVIVLVIGVTVFVIGTAVTAISCIPQYAFYSLIQTAQDPFAFLQPKSAAVQYFAQFKAPDAAKRKQIADLIVQIGLQRKLSKETIAIAVATAIQESGLQNLTYGDRDSLGIYQQRPSVLIFGTTTPLWGTAEQILNPNYAINRFYDALVKISDRDSRPMVDVALQVQGASSKAYHATWKWDDIATEIVSNDTTTVTTSANVCIGSGTNATLADSNGSWQGPLAGSYKQGDGFGERIWPFPPYELEFHNGVDLEVVYGTPVYAVHDGTVASAAFTGTLGKFVLLNHGNNIQSGYGHLSGYGPGITPGAQVKKGQVIGYVGSTGASTGPHLDFEIRVNDAVVDPVPFMAKQGIVIP